MDTLPPELLVLVAQLYISSWEYFPGEWSLIGQPVSPTQFPQVAPESNVQARNSTQISASPSGDASPITLCHINSRIRAIIQNEPSLWSFLSIRNPRRVDLVHLWLKHLRQAPLYLDLYLNYTTGDASDDFVYDENHPAYQTAHALLQIAPRWRAARMTIHQTHDLTTLFLQAPATALDALGPPPASSEERGAQPSDTEPALDRCYARASAAFRQLETLALFYAPRQGVPDHVGSFIPEEHLQGIEPYYPLIHAPRPKYMHWAMAYFPDWVAPKLHSPTPWEAVTDLVFTKGILGARAWRVLRFMKNLKKIALLGGLRSPVRPGPQFGDYSSSSSETDDLVAISGVEELVLSSPIPSLHVFARWVKFPRLRRLRINLGDNPAVGASRPSDFPSGTMADPILAGRTTSEVLVEVELNGVLLTM